MRPRHPAVLLGAWLSRHITVLPVDHDAIEALLEAEAQAEDQAQASHGSDGLGTMGSQAA